MSNTQCQNELAALEEAADKMKNFFDEIDAKEEWSVSEPDISDLDDLEDFEEWEERDMIPAAEYFTPLQDADHLIEKKHLQVGWAMYLATRSGYGEAALAYLTMNGSDAFIEQCRTEVLPHFNQASSPLLPSGNCIGPFGLESEVNLDDCN